MGFEISFYENDQLVMTARLLATNEFIASTHARNIMRAINADSWAIDKRVHGALSVTQI